MNSRKFAIAVTSVLMSATAVVSPAAQGQDVLRDASINPRPELLADKRSIDDAMTRCHRLYEKLKAANWDDKDVPFSMLLLPDAKYSDKAYYREGNTAVICIPNLGDEDLLFYSDLYIDPQTQYRKGDRVKTNPRGFFIVAFKNGDIKQVPVSDARMAPFPGRPKSQRLVFPGMKAYRPNLPEYYIMALSH